MYETEIAIHVGSVFKRHITKARLLNHTIRASWRELPDRIWKNIWAKNWNHWNVTNSDNQMFWQQWIKENDRFWGFRSVWWNRERYLSYLVLWLIRKDWFLSRKLPIQFSFIINVLGTESWTNWVFLGLWLFQFYKVELVKRGRKFT